MEIKKLQLIEGAKKAEGLTVIIDVFRAFSTACYVFNNGGKKIIPVGELEIAYTLKKENNDFILIGEREGKILPGFDYGNSPALIEKIDFTDKSVIHTTSAGTQGIVNARNSSQIITGSFVNAEAVVDYIIKENPDIVSLVAMGYAGIEPADEDIFCADYLESLIKRKIGMEGEGEQEGKKNWESGKKEMVEILRKGSGKRFFDSANIEWSPPADFDLCLKFDIFDFVLKAERYDHRLFYLNCIQL